MDHSEGTEGGEDRHLHYFEGITSRAQRDVQGRHCEERPGATEGRGSRPVGAAVRVTPVAGQAYDGTRVVPAGPRGEHHERPYKQISSNRSSSGGVASVLVPGADPLRAQRHCWEAAGHSAGHP